MYKGNINLLSHPNKIAVIGSRNCSFEQRKLSERLGYNIADTGVLVSGLANGIDTHAAIGNIYNDHSDIGQIAVVPTFPSILPDNNKLLSEDIIDNGGLIFCPDSNTKDLRELYLLRDRVIVDLADIVCVIGDVSKGGTGYTYNFAKKMGKEIYLNDECERLIKL